MKDAWNPTQYNKYKEQRSQPFWDLFNLVKKENIESIVDLGCGTGELTRQLHEKLLEKSPNVKTLGIDSSSAMLEESSKFAVSGLHFQNKEISQLSSEPNKYDLVFSNAALQWPANHEELFPRLLALVKNAGQIAIQMPCNFDHPSHRIAGELLKKYTKDNAKTESRNILSLERYAEILYHAGFEKQICKIQVYLHPMASSHEVVEWTKGTLLTSAQKILGQSDYQSFLDEYTALLLAETGVGHYLYTFKRMLLWGQKKD